MKIVGLLFVLCAVTSADNESSKDGLVSYMAPRSLQATVMEFPYVVSIQNRGRHHCGGALISMKHVLTAAHCLDQEVAQSHLRVDSQLTVEVGSIYIGRGKTHEILRLAIAKGYNAGHSHYIHPNDIGMVQLREPVKFSANVQTISLALPNSEVPVEARTIIAGFGNDQYGKQTSPFLKKSEMYIVSMDECNRYYQSTWQRTIISSQICAKLGPGSGVCQGDSGSPLVYNNQVIAVVTASDKEKCGTGSPDIYTRVTPFLEFIYDELNYKL